MRRWNGWGEETVGYPLSGSAVRYLEEALGPGERPQDVAMEEVRASVPPSRLPSHPLIWTDGEERLRHARGQSLPDWVALRSGNIQLFPDGVAFPHDRKSVGEILRHAREWGAQVIPYGGGTSVVGHINPLQDERPAITMDMSLLAGLLRFDERNQMALFGAGVRGPDLEAHLRPLGVTLGHFPQSFEFSTLGGWIATRSSGQQSMAYGRIERLFAGGHLETPLGPLDLPDYPASAAGPDLREVVLGSEGRLGVITDAMVRVSPLPEREDFPVVFFPYWEQGLEAVRRMVQARLPLSMVRLSNSKETEVTLALAGHHGMVRALEAYLSLRRAGQGRCLCLLGLSGRKGQVKGARREVFDLVGRYEGIHVGQSLGRAWHESRFRTPYLRNTLWELGYGVDTMETAAPWSHIKSLGAALESTLTHGLKGEDERVLVFSHLSHLYPYGSSLYTTCLFRRGKDPEVTLRRWRSLKSAASQAIKDQGGTISHHHGVGVDHLPYMEAEKGGLGLRLLSHLVGALDPEGMMNPGKLVSSKDRRTP